jgi:hypothetical protein
MLIPSQRGNAKAALLWFAKEKDVLPHGVPLSPTWDQMRAQLTDRSTRYRLIPLMRFCSGLGIKSENAAASVLDRYMDHRARTTARASDSATRRFPVRLDERQILTLFGGEGFGSATHFGHPTQLNHCLLSGGNTDESTLSG